MKIAIVGSGISGLTAAYYLNEQHDIKVFEANGYIGGHTDTHDLVYGGKDYRVDSGFIVFNETNYPNFVNLMNRIGVPYQDSNMSFSVFNERKNLEYNATNLKGLFSQKRNLLNPKFLRMLFDITRFYKEAPELLQDAAFRELTLSEYLESNGYSQAFMEDHLYPMTGALWSASPDKVKDFPAHYLVSFMLNHKMMQVDDRPMWKVIQGGSSSYIKALTKSFAHKIHLNCAVSGVERSNGGVKVKTKDGCVEVFDKVVFACHSDQALNLLQDPTIDEVEVLGNIQYQENHMVLHSDPRVLPRRQQSWASWNAMVPEQEGSRCFVSYYMNTLQNLDAPIPFITTLNSTMDIDHTKVWCERTYHHPVYTFETLAAQAKWSQINGMNNSYFCGAYWSWGFHEDGVKSALKVVDSIDAGALQYVA